MLFDLLHLGDSFRGIATMIVLYVAIAALTFWYFFMSRIPAGLPNGPWFRLPIIGHFYLIGTDPIAGFHKLRKR